MSRFNSILVQLNFASFRFLLETIKKFQFHSGSIKLLQRRAQADPRPMFQFHSGSIKLSKAKTL